jgi:hypothetical protein
VVLEIGIRLLVFGSLPPPTYHRAPTPGSNRASTAERQQPDRLARRDQPFFAQFSHCTALDLRHQARALFGDAVNMQGFDSSG